MRYYAVFAGDEHYHLVRPKSTTHILCGLATLKRDRSGGDYRPRARVLPEPPPASLYRSCPRCVAEENVKRRQDAGPGTKGGADE